MTLRTQRQATHTRIHSDWQFITHSAADPLLDLSGAQTQITLHGIGASPGAGSPSAAVDEEACANGDEAFMFVAQTKPAYAAVAALPGAHAALGNTARQPSIHHGHVPVPLNQTIATDLAGNATEAPLLRVASANASQGARVMASRAAMTAGASWAVELKKSGKHYVARR